MTYKKLKEQDVFEHNGIIFSKTNIKTEVNLQDGQYIPATYSYDQYGYLHLLEDRLQVTPHRHAGTKVLTFK